MRGHLKTLLDMVLPPRCGGCGEPVDETPGLCAKCWSHLTFLTRPFCEQCGFPFELDIEGDLLCGPCLGAPPLYTKLRSVFCYEEKSKDLILRFKHGDATYLAPLLVTWMARASEEFLQKADMILPVPLHWTRLMKRGYNQAALLARGLSKKTGVPYAPDLLKRVRQTVSQGHLSPVARRKNVSQAFCVKDSRRKNLAEKNVLLVDDVFTSGATITECVKALKKSGVKDIFVLTLARVLKSR